MKKLLMFCLMLTVASSAYAIKIIGGPVLQNVTENSFSVVWTTDKNAVAWVEIAPDDGTHFYACERPKYFQTVLGRKCIGKNHCVTVHGLEKATRYRYRIYTQEVIKRKGRITYGYVAASRIFRARPFNATTLDYAKESINCLIMNDVHGTEILETMLKDRVDINNTDMVIYNGDMASLENNYVYRIWKSFINTSVKYFAKDVPLVMVRGVGESLGTLGQLFNVVFPTPTGKPYRTLRQGPVCFIILDSGFDQKDKAANTDFDAYRAEEARWLKEALQSPEVKEAKYRVALMHVPPIAKASNIGKQLNKLFVPILNEADIDVMLCGYTHQHMLHEANKNTKFPILENSHLNVIKLRADGEKLVLVVENLQGEQVQTLTFENK
ncbi:MAG: metallophosphoesterase [Alistipes sp.]|nr:metallophosphoesterase [Alistipes sp.]